MIWLVGLTLMLLGSILLVASKVSITDLLSPEASGILILFFGLFIFIIGLENKEVAE